MTENDNDDYEEIGILSKKKMRYKAFHTIVSEISRKPVNEGMLVWYAILEFNRRMLSCNVQLFTFTMRIFLPGWIILPEY